MTTLFIWGVIVAALGSVGIAFSLLTQFIEHRKEDTFRFWEEEFGD